ncbi:MAG: Arthrobacter phage Sonali [Pseudomonadota bacterium]|jgi:hypothetical protein
MNQVNDLVLVYGLTAGGEPIPLKVAADGTLQTAGGGGGGGGSTIDREIVMLTYRVKTAFTGATVGDLITQAQVIDVTSTPTTVAVLWRNHSTGVDLANAPNLANLEPVVSTGLTDAQLRAAAVPTAPNYSRGVGNADANTLRATLAADGPAVAGIGSIDAKTPALVGGAVPVTGPLTNAQLRSEAVDVISQNITTKFREAFEEYVPNTGGRWLETKANGDIVMLDGNTAAASYLVVSKSPFDAGTRTDVETAITFDLPIDIAFGASMSQRTVGQEFSVEVVSTDATLPEAADLAIASLSQTTTVLTVNTTLPHGLTVGRCIGIRDCSNLAANYPNLVVATTPSPTQFTCTVATGTIATVNNSGFVYNRERFGRAQDAISQIFETATATQANLYVRSESGDALPSGVIGGAHAVTVGTTASVQLAGATAAYAYSFAPTTEYRMTMQADRVQWHDAAVDSLTQSTGRLLRTQVCPTPDKSYKFRLRAINNKSLSVISAKVTSVTKSGTTTGTFVTATPHGLATGDLVNYFGSSSSAAAAFPNLATATAVTVVDATTFTAVIGTGTTGVAYGGFVAKVQGGNLMSALGAQAQTVTNVALSTLADGQRQLVLTGSGNWAMSIGDLVEVVGCTNTTNGTLLGVDGTWKVANQATTALTLVALPGQTWPADFSAAAGGAVVRRTDFRLSFVRIFDYERQRVEHIPRPATDSAGAIPAVLQGGTAAVTVSSGTVTTVTTVTTVAAVTAANLNIPGTVADVASAALAATATTAAFTPTFGTSYEVNIPVTVVTGTNPTLDFSVEESDDAGTNWFKVYDFPRITAVGIYRSPKLPLTGNRVRYVQTLGGSTPSFTRAVNRLQSSDDVPLIRQLIDRALAVNTLNQATASLNVQNCRNVQAVLALAAGGTAPSIQLEGSDDNGVTWYAIGAALAGTVGSTVQLTVNNVQSQLVRGRVSTAGTGATLTYLLIKGF